MSKMTDRENVADLLDLKQFDGVELEETSCKVSDGGCRAWTVCLATAWVFGMYLGYEFNYGLIYAKLIEEYNSTTNSALYAGINPTRRKNRALRFFFIIKKMLIKAGLVQQHLVWNVYFSCQVQYALICLGREKSLYLEPSYQQ